MSNELEFGLARYKREKNKKPQTTIMSVVLVNGEMKEDLSRELIALCLGFQYGAWNRKSVTTLTRTGSFWSSL